MSTQDDLPGGFAASPAALPRSSEEHSAGAQPLAWFGKEPCCFGPTVAGLEYATCAESDRDCLSPPANVCHPDNSNI